MADENVSMHWVSCLLALVFMLAGAAPVAAQSRPERFRELKIQPPDAPGSPEFTLSAAGATSISPVVVSVAGRKLNNADRQFRTSLQKYWLRVNVPDRMRLIGRSLVKCAYERKGEFAFCDEYVFDDPASSKRESYFIYVGNWP